MSRKNQHQDRGLEEGKDDSNRDSRFEDVPTRRCMYDL